MRAGQVAGCVPPTFRKCRVAWNSGESASGALAHCSASGVSASRQSWETSELILIRGSKNQPQVMPSHDHVCAPGRGHREAGKSALGGGVWGPCADVQVPSLHTSDRRPRHSPLRAEADARQEPRVLRTGHLTKEQLGTWGQTPQEL